MRHDNIKVAITSVLMLKLLTSVLAVPPHVVFVLVDDWGSADAEFREQVVHPNQKPQLRTPAIDSLAAEGMVLQSYYTQHICSPTRTALLSGRYQIHTGLQDGIIQAWARVCLPPKFGTLGDAFSLMGYHTIAIGKWHAGIYRDSCLPWQRGFERYFGFLTGSEYHYTKMQRIARGSAHQNGTTQLYPDLRTDKGPVKTHCIAPPLDPPPPPPPPCGLPGQPACMYTSRQGYLAAGHDAIPFANMSVAGAEAACDALANCSAITFQETDPKVCETAPHCKMYFKLKEAGTTTGGAGWLTLFKYPPPPSSQGDPSCYSTHMYTQHATAAIAMHANSRPALPGSQQPLFMYLALQDVHEPIEVPSQYVAPFVSTIHDERRRTYAGMVAVVDECLANVTSALKAANMWADSILVVSNDNGGWAGYGGINMPYRGHKTTLWEGGIRGIGLVVAPGRLPAGARYGGLFHVTDWLPTLVSAAGGNASSLGPAFAHLDGVDQWAALAQAAPGGFPRTELLHNIEGVQGRGIAAIRVGRYKLLHNMQRGFDGWCDTCNNTGGCYIPPKAGYSVGDNGTTVGYGGQLCCTGAPSWMTNASMACAPVPANHSDPLPLDLLYDIVADPSELHDLAPSRPDLVHKLRERLDTYNATNVPCCICTGSGRTNEMDVPPRDGYWYSFHDQSDNPDPNCALQNEPPHVAPWSRDQTLFEELTGRLRFAI